MLKKIKSSYHMIFLLWKKYIDDKCSSFIQTSKSMKTSVQYMWKLVQPQKTETILFMNNANLTSDKYYFLESRYHSWDLGLKTVMKRHSGTYLCQEFADTGLVTLKNYTLVVNGMHSVWF